MAKNKVVYGFSNLHVGEWNVADDGTVTMTAPYHQIGAIGFSPEQDSETTNFAADDIDFWSYISEGAFKGDLIVANFDDEFRTRFLGWAANTNGGIGPVKGAVKPSVYVAFELKGDKEKRRLVFYGGTFGPVKREYNTIDGTPEPATDTLPTSFTGDNNTGKMYDVFKPGDDGYDTLFTAPTAPVLAP